VLNRILHSEYSILTAKSGKIALGLAAEEKPRLIILDIMLADMSGFDVLRKLKENSETRQIPVIIVSGFDSDEDEEKGFLLGAVDYIKKPYRDAIVKARVRTHLEIMLQMQAIEKLGLTDPLTEIPNRRNFDDRLAMEWRRALREKKSISLLIMDLDKFKNYNDTYGHPQGDQLLKSAARIFAMSVRRPADLPARIGGEEFAILLPDTSLSAALSIAESIRANIEAMLVPTADENEMTRTTISIGVASVIPEESDTAANFIAVTYENLYAAKAAGRNRVFPTE